MSEYFKYLYLCDYKGLAVAIIILVGAFILIFVGIEGWKNRRIACFFGFVMIFLGIIGVIASIIRAHQEIRTEEYFTLVEKAKVMPDVKAYLNHYMMTHDFIARKDYCVLMHKIKKNELVSLKQQLQHWKSAQ